MFARYVLYVQYVGMMIRRDWPREYVAGKFEITTGDQSTHVCLGAHATVTGAEGLRVGTRPSHELLP